HSEFRALGRSLGSVDDIFDGSRGSSAGTFFPTRPMSKAQLRESRVLGSFYGPLDWKRLFKHIAVTGTGDVAGEPSIVLELAGENEESPITVHVSSRTSRILQREYTRSSSVGQSEFITEQYADYRDVDGAIVPFEITERAASPGAGGETITKAHVREFKFEPPDWNDAVFRVSAP